MFVDACHSFMCVTSISLNIDAFEISINDIVYLNQKHVFMHKKIQHTLKVLITWLFLHKKCQAFLCKMDIIVTPIQT